MTATYELWVFTYGEGLEKRVPGNRDDAACCPRFSFQSGLQFPMVHVFAVGFIWLLYHHVLSHSIAYISIHIKQSKLHDVAASPSWFSAASSHPYLSEIAQLIIRFCIQSNSGSINMRWKGMFFHLWRWWRWVSWWSWRAISCKRNQPWLKRLTNGDTIYRGKFTIKNMQPCQHRSWTS